MTAARRLMPVRLALPVRLGRCDFIWYRNISHLSKGEALLVDDIKLSRQREIRGRRTRFGRGPGMKRHRREGPRGRERGERLSQLIDKDIAALLENLRRKVYNFVVRSKKNAGD